MSDKGPIIVVGTGRSGTSTVSRLLHEQLGICMGHFFKLHTEHDYYEDLFAHALNRMLAQRAVTVMDWRVAMAKQHASCGDWGFKDPHFVYAHPDDIKAIQPRLFIRTWRERDATVDSWIRHYRQLGGKGAEPELRVHFAKLCLEREMLMDWKLEGYPVVMIRFDGRRLTDEEIVRAIKPKLAEV